MPAYPVSTYVDVPSVSTFGLTTVAIAELEVDLPQPVLTGWNASYVDEPSVTVHGTKLANMITLASITLSTMPVAPPVQQAATSCNVIVEAQGGAVSAQGYVIPVDGTPSELILPEGFIKDNVTAIRMEYRY